MAKKSRKKRGSTGGTPRSNLGKKNAASRKLTQAGTVKLPTEHWGNRGFVYQFYEIQVLAPELIQDVIDRSELDFFKGEAASVALQLEILETKSNETFTNQTPFILYDEEGVADSLAQLAAEVVDDPSPDSTVDTSRFRGKPNYAIVRVVVVIQRGSKL